MNNKNIHIALDLDKTLAEHESKWGVSKIGPPIAPMVENVKLWLSLGYKVTIFTARMCRDGKELENQIVMIREFLLGAGLPNLPKTAMKSSHFTHFIDDRAYHCDRNVGIISDKLDIECVK